MSESNLTTEKLIGVEVSKSAFKAICFDGSGNITDSLRYKIDRANPTFPQLVNFLNEAKNKFGGVEKVGVAVPGLVHHETKRITYSTYIPEHEATDFLGNLEGATNLKITIENDANAAAYGEYRLGAGLDSRDLFFVTLGTGVGGAFILNGKIWRGSSGFAGEFGQIAINSEGMKLEDVASNANIVRRTKSRFHQDSTSSLGKLDEDEIRIANVVREARDGDDFARLMLDRTGIYVGTAIASVINLLNIERVIISGQIIEAENIVLDAIIRRAKELTFAPSFEATQILGSRLGENAAAAGAGLLSAESGR
ncbi:MAG: ROK family protein [Acidobacteriota bacterium]|nr:ROK family protein [Acidobacteriota bacterium]